MNITLYIGVLITLAILDSIWLFTMGGHYRQWLNGLFASSFNFTPAVIFYLIYAAGVVFFVISPAVRAAMELRTVFFTGAFLGLVAYATYDLTNHATLKGWPLTVTLVDIVWGTLLTGIASVIVVAVYNAFK
jgi:uncharacterized membrane protein